MQIKVINKGNQPLPHYATAGAAGLDLRADLEKELLLKSGERTLVPTGLQIEIPEGYEAQVRPRSGLAYKNGVTVLNSPGTIDSDFRGEMKVLLINHSNEDFIIQPGERIAQLVVAPYTKISWVESELLMESARGEGGYGSTGRE